MEKESQYRPESIRGRQPKKQPEIETKQQPTDDTSVWDVIKAPFEGALHGLFNTGIKTRDQLQRQKQRQIRGLPPLRYKKPPYLLNPFRRTSSSWFKKLCERKPLE